MKRPVQLWMFFIFATLVPADEIGSECAFPVKCLGDKNFTFCSIVDGQPVLQNETFTCPDGYICVPNPYAPCVEAPTTTTTTTSSTKSPVTIPSSFKCFFGATFPASICNQYYECERVLWWYEVKLRTCFLGLAYDPIRKRCVPRLETGCVL
ncbi:unnamed protein product [Tenebrio molitor]|jgi:hypothetical protein|nr:unnamed protein product [Tenebrio molitor]